MLSNTSRFLLTDILPYELPVIFTNLDFVKYISTILKSKTFFDVNEIIGTYSIPYKYEIIKDKKTNRTISLSNPLSHIQTVYFIDKFKEDIIQFIKIYGGNSLRKPIDISPTNIKEKRIKQLFSRLLSNAESLNIENYYEDIKVSPYFESYFVNAPYSRIHEFQDDGEIIKLERRFKYMLKTDIQDCFNSIYTHSISWAYTGSKDLAKQKVNYNSFDNTFDLLMQKSNYNETNGILIGSNLSRIFSEIIFCKIDYLTIRELEQKGYKEERDFKYYRYIDDIFVFSNELEIAENIKEVIKRTFSSFNLRTSSNKTYIENRPFSFNRNWYLEAKEIMSTVNSFVMNEQYCIDIFKKNGLISDNSYFIDYNLIFLKYKDLIKRNVENEVRISNYITSSLTAIAFKMFKMLEDLDIMTKNTYLSKKSIVSFYTNIMNQVTYITAINLSYSSVNNLYQLISLIKTNFIDHNINNSLYVKYKFVLSDIEKIIEANIQRTESSNLIILLSLLNEKINTNSLSKYLEKYESLSNDDIFVLFALALHIKNNIDDPDFKNKCVYKINNIIENKISLMMQSNLFSNVNLSDRNMVTKTAIISDNYYFLNGFYSYPHTSQKNKKKIQEIVFNNTFSHNDPLLIMFQKYRGSFINWNQSLSDSLKVLLGNKKITTQYSN